MASQPPSWPSRSSSNEQSTSNAAPIEGMVRTTSEATSTTSEDSQTVILNHGSSDTHLAETPQSNASDAAAAATTSQPAITEGQPEPRHCWICLQDEGDDNSSTSEWRSPCPCNLQAHEECMLEWITDLEATSTKRDQLPTTKIQCPQCKADIKIERPVEYIVILTDLVRRIARLFVLPAGVSAVFGCLYSGSMVYGINALSLVFGPQEAYNMLMTKRSISLARFLLNDRWYGNLLRFIRGTDPFLPLVPGLNWEVFLGLPMIAPALVLSRTSLADHAFSLLPIGYFMIQHDTRGLRHWPPSPGITFATLPYIRSLYNELYKHTFSDLEKKWDKAVMRKPREGETAEDVARAQDDDRADNGLLDIELEIINVEAGGNDPGPQNPIDAFLPEQPAQPIQQQEPNRPDIAGEQQNPPAEQPDQAPAQGPLPAAAAAPVRAGDWEFRRNISTAQVVTGVMGALFFPAVSSVMGDILKLTLPTRWVTKPVITISRYQSRHAAAKGIQATGLLQEKWGRSVIGACLFIVLKDALILYCKWRRAKNAGKMRVLDYVPKKGAKREGRGNAAAA